MKLISTDKAFIYYMRDRADGKAHGIRFSRTAGATGFVSDAPTKTQSHPVPFAVYDNAVALPIRGELPPVLANALADLEEQYPEIHALLTGRITFEDALRS